MGCGASSISPESYPNYYSSNLVRTPIQQSGTTSRMDPIPRFIMNIVDEPSEMLSPIQGYEKEPALSLEEACQSLIEQNIVPDLPRQIWIAKQNSKKPADGLTQDQSAAIHLYTMDWSNCVYVLLNHQLRAADRRKLIPWFRYLKLFLTALHKLPSVKGIVWRGVNGDMSDEYKEGEEKVWWGFSSCTSTMNVLQDSIYLTECGPRTLFGIETFNGKMIKNHSYFKSEDEILLLPGTFVRTTGRLHPGNDLHIVHLKQEQPPYPLITLPGGHINKQQWSLPIQTVSAKFQQQTAVQDQRTNATVSAPPLIILPLAKSVPKEEPKSVKRIQFYDIPNAHPKMGVIPQGYAGFHWSELSYLEEEYVRRAKPDQWQALFTYSRYIGALLSSPSRLTLRSMKPGGLFSVSSFEAAALDNPETEWLIQGLKNNLKVYEKMVKFKHYKYQLFEINYMNIDEFVLVATRSNPYIAICSLDVLI